MKVNNFLKILCFIVLLAGCSKEDSPEEGTRIDKSANLKTLGASANDLLSDEKFTSIHVEMVYVTGYEPSAKTIENLKTFLSARTYKPDGVRISKRAVSSSNKAPFNIDEIVEIESNERLIYNAGDEIAVFIYFADGSNDEDGNSTVVLGSAFRNTSMVIYGKTVQNISDRVNAPDKSTVESTVVNHEFGHLLGLVDLGTPMQRDHLDDESRAHCNVTDCLMVANVSFGSGLLDVVDNNTILQLDDFCIMDLQANGGK